MDKVEKVKDIIEDIFNDSQVKTVLEHAKQGMTV
jgi:hypothetical protein